MTTWPGTSIPKSTRNAYPPAGYLRECFQYEPDTGVLTWRIRPDNHFHSVGIARRVNRKAGKPVGTNSDGYLKFSLTYKGDRISMHVHRVVYYMSTGELPDNIDHIDGDRSNNRLANLRAATNAENRCNTGVRRHNKLGVKGVQRTPHGRYQARISLNKKHIYLGTFSDIESASAAYLHAAINHRGEFARVKNFDVKSDG